MKKKLFAGIFLLFLLTITASAEEKYIIKLNDRINTLNSDNITCKYITVDKEELTEYLEAGVVEFYEPDFTVELFETFRTDEGENLSWNHEMLKLSKARNIGCFGNDVKIGVIDSGINYHEDLSANVLPGYNFVNNTPVIEDDIGHGTFVSGIIAAEINGKYIDGIAACAKLVPLQCFNLKNQSPSAATVANAIRSAVDDFGCRVINMSFGGGAGWANKTLEDAVNYALSKNCILVAAVGNYGSTTLQYPAAYDGVVGVGAVTSSGRLWSYSQRNKSVDCVAPGAGITSIVTLSNNADSGTSFSTPHITALAAIAINIDENITPEKFTEVLTSTCTDLGSEGRDNYYGYGLANAEAMVDRLLENKEIFISPFLEKAGKISATVYNNSKNSITASGIFAEYENNILKNTNCENISVEADETINLSFSPISENFKFMIWSDKDKIAPLSQLRKYQKNQ